MWRFCESFPGIPLGALAIVLAAACGSDGGGGPSGTVPPPTSIDITTGATPPPRFIPVTATLAAGGTVKWTNGSPADHNLITTSSNWTLSEDLPVGQSFETTIAQAGTYRYECTIHPGMTATIEVR